MPTRICPHCGTKFAKESVLDTHIKYLHQPPRTQLAAPTPQKSTQGPRGYHADYALEDEDLWPWLQYIGPPTFTPVNNPAHLQPSIESDFPSAVPSQGTTSTTWAPHSPPLSSTPSHPRAGDAPPSARTFTIVYEAKGHHHTQRFTVPHTEPFADFQRRMAAVSAPVGGCFIAGRATGFQPEDQGEWRYSLVDRTRGLETPGDRLTSNILYQAMISQLLKAKSEWNYALLWHDIQKGSPLPMTWGPSSPPPFPVPALALQVCDSCGLASLYQRGVQGAPEDPPESRKAEGARLSPKGADVSRPSPKEAGVSSRPPKRAGVSKPPPKKPDTSRPSSMRRGRPPSGARPAVIQRTLMPKPAAAAYGYAPPAAAALLPAPTPSRPPHTDPVRPSPRPGHARPSPSAEHPRPAPAASLPLPAPTLGPHLSAAHPSPTPTHASRNQAATGPVQERRVPGAVGGGRGGDGGVGGEVEGGGVCVDGG